MARRRSLGFRRARLLWVVAALGGIGWAAWGRLQPPGGWQQIAPGLAYRELRVPAGEPGVTATLHAIRADPAHYRVRLISNGERTATAKEMATAGKALAAINGGFFDERFRPLGLRVSGGKVLHPLRRADWGVFLTRGGQPAIVHTRAYRPEGVEEALQCGPRLVVDGRATKLRRQSARRAGVGIDRAGRVLLVVSGGADMDAAAFARALQAPEAKGGLGCLNAMNLDGGPSAQLYAARGSFRLDLPGTWGVPDGLGVFRR